MDAPALGSREEAEKHILTGTKLVLLCSGMLLSSASCPPDLFGSGLRLTNPMYAQDLPRCIGSNHRRNGHSSNRLRLQRPGTGQLDSIFIPVDPSWNDSYLRWGLRQARSGTFR